MTFRSSSQFHRSCSRGFLWLVGDLRLPELQGPPDSDVEDTSTGDSRPLSASDGLTKVQSMPTGSGVDVTDDADVSTNFSAKKNYFC